MGQMSELDIRLKNLERQVRFLCRDSNAQDRRIAELEKEIDTAEVESSSYGADFGYRIAALEKQLADTIADHDRRISCLNKAYEELCRQLNEHGFFPVFGSGPTMPTCACDGLTIERFDGDICLVDRRDREITRRTRMTHAQAIHVAKGLRDISG